MSFEVPNDDYEHIRELITSADSPVGIDAERTHVMILYLLQKLQSRVAELEQRIERALQEESPS